MRFTRPGVRCSKTQKARATIGRSEANHGDYENETHQKSCHQAPNVRGQIHIRLTQAVNDVVANKYDGTFCQRT